MMMPHLGYILLRRKYHIVCNNSTCFHRQCGLSKQNLTYLFHFQGIVRILDFHNILFMLYPPKLRNSISHIADIWFGGGTQQDQHQPAGEKDDKQQITPVFTNDPNPRLDQVHLACQTQ